MREAINNSRTNRSTEAAISAAQLLHPSKHINHPHDVLVASDIGDDAKRAIFASWASDLAIESNPALRLYPGTDKAVLL